MNGFRGVVLALLLAATFAVPVHAAFAPPSVPERLVEGHTVFTVLETVGNATQQQAVFAAAVAVLVQSTPATTTGFRFRLGGPGQTPDSPADPEVGDDRFPGVLWFDDQYLVAPRAPRKIVDFPCSGAVLAVPTGAPSPLVNGEFDAGTATYQYSVGLIDPSSNGWTVDKFVRLEGTPVWTVAVLNRTYDPGLPTDDCPPLRTPCGARMTNCTDIRYNAVLYFRFSEVPGILPSGAKDHRQGGYDSGDMAACHRVTEWPCPPGTERCVPDIVAVICFDDREGNNHDYVPTDPAHSPKHGGSARCPDGNTHACHGTRHIDLYFGTVVNFDATNRAYEPAAPGLPPGQRSPNALCGATPETQSATAGFCQVEGRGFDVEPREVAP